MNISPISFNKFSFNSSIQKTSCATNPFKSDFFVKSTSFGSSNKADDTSFEAFEKWAEETNFLDNALKMINETAPILGSGFEGTTYGIPDCDRWVMKEYKRSNLLKEGLKRPRITKVDDISPELNIGQFVATVKIPLNSTTSHHFYILKRQEGKSFGVQFADRNAVSDLSVKKHINSLKELSSYPIETYTRLLNDIEYINNRGYELDCVNPYNFMIDSSKQQINFVDANDKKREEGFQYGDVLFALLDGDFATAYEKSDRPDAEKDEVNKCSTTICSKFLTAMVRKHARFTPTEKFLKVYNSPTFIRTLGESDPYKKEDLMIKLGLY